MMRVRRGFIDELRAYPSSGHDDIVNALPRGLAVPRPWWWRMARRLRDVWAALACALAGHRWRPFSVNLGQYRHVGWRCRRRGCGVAGSVLVPRGTEADAFRNALFSVRMELVDAERWNEALGAHPACPLCRRSESHELTCPIGAGLRIVDEALAMGGGS